MNAILKAVIDRAEKWPVEDQEELAQLALEIELRREGAYHALPHELEAIDAGLAEVERGGLASDEAVEALLSKYRRG